MVVDIEGILEGRVRDATMPSIQVRSVIRQGVERLVLDVAPQSFLQRISRSRLASKCSKASPSSPSRNEVTTPDAHRDRIEMTSYDRLRDSTSDSTDWTSISMRE
jgi:hypothetical protein